MSRVGIHPVEIAKGVNVKLEGQKLTVSGSKGNLFLNVPENVTVSVEDSKVTFKPANDSIQARSAWGMARNITNNMVKGVSEGFTINLEINGVGYRAAVAGKTLKLNLGFSHDVNYPIPDGIKIECPKQTEVVISGCDKQVVGQVAAEIRSYRKPEPYKGKGIKYSYERVRRKEGKKK